MSLPPVPKNGAVCCWLKRELWSYPVLLLEHNNGIATVFLSGMKREVAVGALQFTQPHRLRSTSHTKGRGIAKVKQEPERSHDLETAIWRLAENSELLQLQAYSLQNDLPIPENGLKRLAQLREQKPKASRPKRPRGATAASKVQPPPRSPEAREEALQQRLQHLEQHDWHDWAEHPCPLVRAGWSHVWRELAAAC